MVSKETKYKFAPVKQIKIQNDEKNNSRNHNDYFFCRSLFV